MCSKLESEFRHITVSIDISKMESSFEINSFLGSKLQLVFFYLDGQPFLKSQLLPLEELDGGKCNYLNR